jgi:hypothetical protein
MVRLGRSTRVGPLIRSTGAPVFAEERAVPADDPPMLDRAAHRSIRETIGERLRAYYDHAQQMPLSEPLVQLVAQFEKRLESDPGP